jgi:hypothetical protein
MYTSLRTMRVDDVHFGFTPDHESTPNYCQALVDLNTFTDTRGILTANLTQPVEFSSSAIWNIDDPSNARIDLQAYYNNTPVFTFAFSYEPAYKYSIMVSLGQNNYISYFLNGTFTLTSASNWVLTIDYAALWVGDNHSNDVFSTSVGFLGNSDGSIGAVSVTITELGSSVRVYVPIWLQWDFSNPSDHINLRLGFNTTTNVYNAITFAFNSAAGNAVTMNANIGVFNVSSVINGSVAIRTQSDFTMTVTNFQAGLGKSMSPGISAIGSITYAIPDGGDTGLISISASNPESATTNQFGTIQMLLWDATELPSSLLIGVISMFSLPSGTVWSIDEETGYSEQINGSLAVRYSILYFIKKQSLYCV